MDGSKQAILFSFVLDKPPGYKVFYNPGTVLYEKVNKSVPDTIIFYLEDNSIQFIEQVLILNQ